MEGNSKSRIAITILIVSILAIGLAAFAFRYKTVLIGDTVLLIERWRGIAALVYSDGSSLQVEGIGAIRGPILLPKKAPKDDNTQVRARIKWRSGYIYCVVRAQPYTDWLKKSRKNRKAQYVIELLDRDGFVIQTLRIPIYKMKAVRSEENTIEALEYRTSRYLYRHDFKAIRNWNIR